MRGVFPYSAGTLLDPTYLRLFTSPSVMQLLLDAGYAPDTVDRIERRRRADGHGRRRGRAAVRVAGRGRRRRRARPADRPRCSCAAPAARPRLTSTRSPSRSWRASTTTRSSTRTWRRSPCLRDRSPHELLRVPGLRQRGRGPERRDRTGRARVRRPRAPGRLPARGMAGSAWWPSGDWPKRRGAPSASPGCSACWTAGSPSTPSVGSCTVTGCSSHRSLPADVDGLDELLMVVPRQTRRCASTPTLGWHLYGTDLALQAQQRELRVVVVDAPCHHNSLTGGCRGSTARASGSWPASGRSCSRSTPTCRRSAPG